MPRTAVLLLALLALAGPAHADLDLEDLRGEIVELRAELIDQDLLDVRAVRHLEAAIEALGPVLGTIDEKDDDLTGRLFPRLAKAMRKMESAARKEESETFTAFVEDWNQRLWLLTAALPVPQNPAVTNPETDKLQSRLMKKLWKASRRAAEMRFPAAVKKLGPAWKIHVRIGRLL